VLSKREVAHRHCQGERSAGKANVQTPQGDSHQAREPWPDSIRNCLVQDEHHQSRAQHPQRTYHRSVPGIR
jgi:hypothetical protein